MKTIYFTRHGESEANAAHVYAGWNDVALTQHGVEQAVAAGEGAKALGITRIFASNLRRAQQTAQIIAEQLGLPIDQIATDARLREINVGKLVGRPDEGIKGYLQSAMDPENPLEVERLVDWHDRVKAAYDDIAATEGDTALIVAHTGVGNMLQFIVEGVTDFADALIHKPNLPNATIIKLVDLESA